MRRGLENTVFKPVPSRSETKNDTTTRVAREIIDSQKADMNAKMARLREERLRREASDEKPPIAAKPRGRMPSKRS